MSLPSAYIMRSTAITPERAIAQWRHKFTPGSVEAHPEIHYPETWTYISEGEGLGLRYRNQEVWKIVVVRYRYSPRGHWSIGYIGYACESTPLPIKQQINGGKNENRISF